ncbi:hypothetical protein, partial [Actinoplanes nipponensis]|uniref:hypothetical protein n=1 Tax=Actinoplanes nipponensis TaxID=135950 RepID=UPI0031E9877C
KIKKKGKKKKKKKGGETKIKEGKKKKEKEEGRQKRGIKRNKENKKTKKQKNKKDQGGRKKKGKQENKKKKKGKKRREKKGRQEERKVGEKRKKRKRGRRNSRATVRRPCAGWVDPRAAAGLDRRARPGVPLRKGVGGGEGSKGLERGGPHATEPPSMATFLHGLGFAPVGRVCRAALTAFVGSLLRTPDGVTPATAPPPAPEVHAAVGPDPDGHRYAAVTSPTLIIAGGPRPEWHTGCKPRLARSSRTARSRWFRSRITTRPAGAQPPRCGTRSGRSSTTDYPNGS